MIRRPVVLSARSFSSTFETGYSVKLTRLDGAGTPTATAVTARQDDEIVVAKTERAFRPLPPFVLFCRFDPAATCFVVCAYSRRRIIPIHKKRAQFSLFCTPTKPFHRPVRIHEEKTRPVGRTFTHMPFGLKNGSISWERLVSVDANSRRGGFLPPHQSSAVSTQAYLHKTPRIIPQTGHLRTKNRLSYHAL